MNPAALDRRAQKAFDLLNTARVTIGLEPRTTFPQGKQADCFECIVVRFLEPGLSQPPQVDALSIWLYVSDVTAEDRAKMAALRRLWPRSVGQPNGRDSYARYARWPRPVSAFIRAFDDGRYPCLVLNE